MATINKIETGRLYGVIAPILPDGEFCICEPIFVDSRAYQKPSAYYLGMKKTSPSKRMGISHFEEIDTTMYGNTIFLPASRKKINDGKKYFILFQPSKNRTRLSLQNYYKFPTLTATFGEDVCFSSILNIGILFPNKFVAIIADSELSEKELLSVIQ